MELSLSENKIQESFSENINEITKKNNKRRAVTNQPKFDVINAGFLGDLPVYLIFTKKEKAMLSAKYNKKDEHLCVEQKGDSYSINTKKMEEIIKDEANSLRRAPINILADTLLLGKVEDWEVQVTYGIRTTSKIIQIESANNSIWLSPPAALQAC